MDVGCWQEGRRDRLKETGTAPVGRKGDEWISAALQRQKAVIGSCNKWNLQTLRQNYLYYTSTGFLRSAVEYRLCPSRTFRT